LFANAKPSFFLSCGKVRMGISELQELVELYVSA